MALLLLHTLPDPVALTHWATRKNWLSPDGDFGYALHALLAAAFDGHPPKSFRYMDEQGLLAYSEESEQGLRRYINLVSNEAQQVLGLNRLRIRAFPSEFPNGKRLGFEVRARPIIRTKAGRERDLYQYRMEEREPDNTDARPSREAIYLDWLDKRLTANKAARLITGSMQGFSLKRVVRRPQKNAANGTRKPKSINGPDALFRGELEVTDTTSFTRLLASGIGRHRAFGYGMLLLRPAQGG